MSSALAAAAHSDAMMKPNILPAINAKIIQSNILCLLLELADQDKTRPDEFTFNNLNAGR
jgi:hypothetical protein